jgi:putative uncharacterized protein gbs1362
MFLIDEMIKKPLVNACANSMSDMFTNFNQSILDAQKNITESPATWGGGNIYSTIKAIHQDAILPLGVVLLTIFIYWDMYNRVIENNNGGEFTTFDFFKIVITAYLGITLLKNSMEITMSFFDVGKKLVETATKSSIEASINLDISALKNNLQSKDIFQLIWLIIGFSISKLFFNIIGLMVWVIIQIRIFQIFFYISLSAVPLSTLTSKDFRNVGFNYMKNLFAYALQGVLIILAFSVYQALLKSQIDTLKVTETSNNFIFKVLAVGVILLALVRQSNVIAKSIVDAH